MFKYLSWGCLGRENTVYDILVTAVQLSDIQPCVRTAFDIMRRRIYMNM